MLQAKQQSRSWKSWTTNLEAQSNFVRSQKSWFKLNVVYIQVFNQQIVQENMTVHQKIGFLYSPKPAQYKSYDGLSFRSGLTLH